MYKKEEAIEILEDIYSDLTYNNWREADKKVKLNIEIIEFRNSKEFIKLQNRLHTLIDKKGLRDKETIRVSQMVDKEINKFYTDNN